MKGCVLDTIAIDLSYVEVFLDFFYVGGGNAVSGSVDATGCF